MTEGFDFDRELASLSRQDLEKLARGLMTSGVALSFHGKRTAMEIAKKVRPRVTRRENKLHVGSKDHQSKNMLIEGENLQAMVTLYKYRGQVDLIVTDPPYNTGQYFRYNDRWDNDPNDPELGTLVTKEDGSRHTKWIKAMMPRLQIMKSMLKPSGVIAICIDDNELFHLGMMMDEVFGEKNRLAILNWQKTYSPKKSNHVASATEYVLVYAKNEALADSALLERTAQMNDRFSNPDKDPNLDWMGGDVTAPESRKDTVFGIQSPHTGELHYPEGVHVHGEKVAPATHHWRFSRKDFKRILEEWGTKYEERDLKDGRNKALVIKGSSISTGQYDPDSDAVVARASERALARRDKENWPRIYFLNSKKGKTGAGRPRLKRYLSDVAQGRMNWTWWADEDYGEPLNIGSVSWEHKLSGHSQAGLRELNDMVGKGHGFQTVKPLKLMKKIIQIWCPNDGLVLDPYAGSGTTGHAVLELNEEDPVDRKFILIEQGAPEKGDKYARSLTWTRLKNAITGERPNGKNTRGLGGGFEYRLLTKTIDAKTVLTMQRDELIDVVLTSHWESQRRTAPNLITMQDTSYQYLIGTDAAGEGYFLIWDNGGPVGSLTSETYQKVVAEAKKANLSAPYHVYARYEMFQSQNVRFWKIPDKILAHLGLDENGEFNSEEVDY